MGDKEHLSHYHSRFLSFLFSPALAPSLYFCPVDRLYSSQPLTFISLDKYLTPQSYFQFGALQMLAMRRRIEGNVHLFAREP